VYIIFNIFAAVFIYWLARVPKGKKFHGKEDKDDLALVRTKSNATRAGAEKRSLAGKDAGVIGDDKGKSTPGRSSSRGSSLSGGRTSVPEITEKNIEKEIEADAPPRDEARAGSPASPVAASTAKEEKAFEAGTVVTGTPERPEPERFVTANEF
jgi:hypothetical protein